MPTAFFDKELYRLRESLAQMGGAVERLLDTALAALRAGDLELADKAILMDKDINEFDNTITNKTILLIATNQPVAGDLRFLAASLRMTNEMERIGDLSANLARRAKALVAADRQTPLPDDIDELAALSRGMLSGALDAFANRNLDKARSVLERDDLVDDLNRHIRQKMVEAIAQDGSRIYWGLEIINTSAHLERLGDHATNLAEEVIYIYSGHNVRHCGPSPMTSPSSAASGDSPLVEGNRGDREDQED